MPPRRLVAGALAMLLGFGALALTGCGDGGEAATDEATTTTTDEPTSTTRPRPTTTTAPSLIQVEGLTPEEALTVIGQTLCAHHGDVTTYYHAVDEAAPLMTAFLDRRAEELGESSRDTVAEVMVQVVFRAVVDAGCAEEASAILEDLSGAM